MYTCRLSTTQYKYATRVLQQCLLTQMTSKVSNSRTVVVGSLDRLGKIYPNKYLEHQSPFSDCKNCSTNASYSEETPHFSAHGTKATAASGVGAEEGHEETLEEVDTEEYTALIKESLYTEEGDDILKALNQCTNLNQLLEVIEKNESALQLKHRVQCVLLLSIVNRDTNNDVANNDLLCHASLERTLTQLQKDVSEMNINELSCCYLYLRKISIPNTHPLMQQLLLKALHIVEISTDLLPLSALSRLLVGINTGFDFHVPTVCRNFMPQIVAHIAVCQSAEDARLLAVCLTKVRSLVDTETLNDYKQRIAELLIAGTINSDQPKVIVKIINMLNLPSWSLRNTHLLRDLLLTLRPCIRNFDDNEIKSVCRVFNHHFEPASLGPELSETMQKILEEKQPPTLEVLAQSIPLISLQKREMLFKCLKQLLNSREAWDSPNASALFFIILRGLKISDIKVCDKYWNSVMQELHNLDEASKKIHYLRHCHRYMNFNNNLGGTYRNFPLEKTLSAMCMDAIENTVEGRIPVRFARLASFVMAYGHTPQSWKKFPNELLSKIINMSEQFSINDCLNLSRGLQSAMELRFRFHTPSLLGMQLATVDSILLNCAERHLHNAQKPLTVIDLNTIVRTLASRKSLRNTTTFHKAMNEYKTLNYCDDLNSRVLRDLTHNLSTSNFFLPEALEAMFDYIEQNHEHVVGDTVEKVLSCAYGLGYVPKSQDVLGYAAQVLMRDFDRMSGLSLVQACLALCFYKTIPEELINRIFCVKFIQRIEEEIQLCYSKATYPERVLNLVMQLNRTVCLDFPEANVPWFQQNYLEAQLSKKHVLKNKFNDEVKELLSTLLKDSIFFRCNHTTPYGYQIDFVIHFDRDKKPIAAPAETAMLDRITKVAILLLKLDSFCENDLTVLRGSELLKIKHLEMMGYKVLHINEHDWNSKYMNAPGAKTNYLKCLLQISS